MYVKWLTKQLPCVELSLRGRDPWIRTVTPPGLKWHNADKPKPWSLARQFIKPIWPIRINANSTAHSYINALCAQHTGCVQQFRVLGDYRVLPNYVRYHRSVIIILIIIILKASQASLCFLDYNTLYNSSEWKQHFKFVWKGLQDLQLKFRAIRNEVNTSNAFCQWVSVNNFNC